MNKAESAIMGARTPEAYIEASFASKLAPSVKVRLARAWMRATGYTAEDIQRARNRHPFWKAKKAEGAAERTKKRQGEHDYSGGVELVWTASLVGEFLGMNGKDETGRYQNKDWEMAKRFRTTIPSIQYMRRRFALAKRSLGPRAGKSEIIAFLCHGQTAEAIPGKKALPAAPKSKSKAGADSRPRAKSAFGVKPVSGRKPDEPGRREGSTTSTRSLSRASSAGRTPEAATPKKSGHRSGSDRREAPRSSAKDKFGSGKKAVGAKRNLAGKKPAPSRSATRPGKPPRQK